MVCVISNEYQKTLRFFLKKFKIIFEKKCIFAKKTMKNEVKYLDPKNDLTFRKIFGERPHLLISFLNSILPLQAGQLVQTIEYLQPELIPELPNLKRSIVDVHCTDNFGRNFIVEMQMYWTSAFKQRMLFNSSKAYVRQLRDGGKYRELRPVYGLSLVDDIFHKSNELKDTFYHHYSLVHNEKTDEKIEGLELIFVELPKFKSQNYADKRLQTLWLRFLTEIDERTTEISEDLLSEETIREALDCVEKSAFTKAELLYYDSYWDAIRVEKAALEELEEKNKILTQENQKAKQREEEAILRETEAKQREGKAKQKIIELAKMLKQLGISIDEISEKTGLNKIDLQNL